MRAIAETTLQNSGYFMIFNTLFPSKLTYISGLLLITTITHASNYTFTVLDVPSNLVSNKNLSSTLATSINNRGQVIGYYDNAGSFPGFIYDGGIYKPLIQPSGKAIQSVYGINDKGQITGSCYFESYPTGINHCIYSYTTNTAKIIYENQGPTTVFGINNDTQFVGRADDLSPNNDQITHGVIYYQTDADNPSRYTETFNIDVPSLIPANTVSYGINDSGVITGTLQEQINVKAMHGFIYDGKNYTQLDIPGAIETFAYDINNVGQVVGSFKDPAGNSHGFIYDGKSYDTVDAPGSDTHILGINDSGQLTGFFMDAKGKHGFLATQSDAASQQASCKTNAIFNIWSKILSIKDVELAGKHYSGKLQYTQTGVNNFNLTDVNGLAISNCPSTEIARFNNDPNYKVLVIPNVSAYGANYQILMHQIDDQPLFEMVDALKL